MPTHSERLAPHDPLLKAVQANDAATVQRELAARYPGQTPPDILISVASREGLLESLDVLLAAGARTGVLGALFGATPMHAAMANGHTLLVDRLLAHGVPLDQKDYCGAFPLNDAIRTGQADTLRHALERGANWRTLRFGTGDRKLNALTYAMLDIKNPAVTQVLVEHGAAQEEPVDARGDTPLHIAARQRWDDVVKALLDQGVPVEVANLRDQTPLGLAVHENAPGCVRWLVAHGADPYRPQGEWDAPMALAQRMSPVLVAAIEHPLMAQAARQAIVDHGIAPSGQAPARARTRL